MRSSRRHPPGLLYVGGVEHLPEPGPRALSLVRRDLADEFASVMHLAALPRGSLEMPVYRRPQPLVVVGGH